MRESISTAVAARRVLNRAAAQFHAGNDEAGSAERRTIAAASRAFLKVFPDEAGQAAVDRTEMRDFSSYIRSGRPGGLMDAELRDLGVSTGAGGGFVVPAAFADQLVITERYFSAMLDNADVWTTPDGAPMGVAAVDDTSHSAASTAENVAISPTSTDFAVTQPNAARLLAGTMYATSVRYSLQSVNDVARSATVNATGGTTTARGGFGIEDQIRFLVGRRIGQKLNLDLTTGAGTAGIPQGLALLGAVPTGTTLATGNSTGFASGAVGYAALEQMVLSVDPQYWADAVWMGNASTYNAIRLLADTTGRPFFDANSPLRPLGWRFVVNPDWPAWAANSAPLFFGSVADTYVVRQVGLPAIKVLEELHMDQLAREVVCYQRVDGMLKGNARSGRVMVASAT